MSTEFAVKALENALMTRLSNVQETQDKIESYKKYIEIAEQGLGTNLVAAKDIMDALEKLGIDTTKYKGSLDLS